MRGMHASLRPTCKSVSLRKANLPFLPCVMKPGRPGSSVSTDELLEADEAGSAVESELERRIKDITPRHLAKISSTILANIF